MVVAVVERDMFVGFALNTKGVGLSSTYDAVLARYEVRDAVTSILST